MPTVALGRQHPLYWVLTSLLGYTPGRLAKELKTNTNITRRWAYGHDPSPEHRDQLLALITRIISSPEYNNQSAREVKDETHKRWMKVTFELVNQYLTQSLPPHKRPRLSELQRSILALLPARRSYVLGQLQRHHSLRAITRAVKHLDILEEPHPTTGILLWRQRDSAPESTPTAKLEPTFVPPRSPRAEELQTLITVYLGRKLDKGITSVKAARLVGHCVARGHSRPAIYRAIKDLCLIRESHGFGAEKVTRYALPHTKED